MSIFKGLSAFPITPCDADGRLITDELRQLLARLNTADVQSIGLLGSTGTYAYLTRETRRAAISAARAVTQKPLIVGVGALRTDEAIALAQDAEQEGAAGLLLAPVSYTPLLQDEVFTHFKAISEATSLPLCIYNNPGTTHFTFSNELLTRLAALPNITAVKMPLPETLDRVSELRAALPADFVLGYSGDWGCADCLMVGGQAWFSVIAGYLPEETAKLARAAEAKNHDMVAQINNQFKPLWELFQTWGSLRVIYAAAGLETGSKAVLPRPLLPLSNDLHGPIKDALATARTPIS